MAADLSVSDVVGQSQHQNAVLTAAMGQLQAANQEGQNASKALEGTENQSASAAGIVAGQEEQGKLTAQENSRAAATSLGTNMDDPSQIITSLGAKLLDNYAQADAINQKIVDDANDNPIKTAVASALRAKTGKPGAAILGNILDGGRHEQLDATTENIKLLSGQLNDINTTTQNIAKTQADLAPVSSAATVLAKSTLAANAFTEKAEEARVRAAQMNISGIQDVTAMSQQQLSNSMNVANLELSAAQKDLMRQNLQIEIADRLDREKIRDETEAGLQGIAGAVQNGIKQLNPGNGLLNLPPQKIIQMIKADPESFKDYLRIGIQSQISGSPQISTDPGQAAQIVVQTNAPLAPAQKSLRNLLTSGYALADKGMIATVTAKGVSQPPAKDPTFNPKDKEQLLNGASGNIKYLADQDARSIDFSNNSNIYQAPTLNSIAALPGVKNNKFFQTVVAPQVKTSTSLGTDPNALFSQALASVNSGDISFSDAVNGLSLTFNAAVKLNNALKQYSSVGIREQHSYNAPIKNPTGGAAIVDMTNSAEISKEFSKQLMLQKIGTEMNIINPVGTIP